MIICFSHVFRTSIRRFLQRFSFSIIIYNHVPVNYDPSRKCDSNCVIKQVVEVFDSWLFFSFWTMWVVKNIHCQRNVPWMVMRQRILTGELDVLGRLNWTGCDRWKWISVVIAGRLTSLLPPVLIILEKNGLTYFVNFWKMLQNLKVFVNWSNLRQIGRMHVCVCAGYLKCWIKT